MIPSDIEELIAQDVKEIANELKETMQGVVHVKTGNLRDSITVEKGKDGIYSVGVDADKLESDKRNKNGYDYSLPYYYGRHNSTWVGHKFLDIALNEVSK